MHQQGWRKQNYIGQAKLPTPQYVGVITTAGTKILALFNIVNYSYTLQGTYSYSY